MADNGIDIAPARRSATAKLANRMLTGFCSSFLRLIAMITNKFKRMVTAEAIGMMTTNIQRMVVFSKSQIKPGNFGQKNTDLVFVERYLSVVSVLFTSIMQCNASPINEAFDFKVRLVLASSIFGLKL